MADPDRSARKFPLPLWALVLIALVGGLLIVVVGYRVLDPSPGAGAAPPAAQPRPANASPTETPLAT